jgi:hypothetical protein
MGFFLAARGPWLMAKLLIAAVTGMVAVWVSLAGVAVAGTITGTVAKLALDDARITLSLVRPSPAGAVSRRAPCNLDNGFAAAAGTALGDAVVRTVNSVASLGLTVTAVGSGRCTLVPGLEDLVSLQVSAAPPVLAQ